MNDYHLTTPQQNIWNLQKYYPDTAITNLCGAIFYKEKRDSAMLCHAIRLFVQSQSGLRLCFRDRETPKQYVSEEVAFDIPELSFSSREELDRYAGQFAGTALELTGQAMFRFVVFQLNDESGILVVLSHLVADAWSFGLMANQVEKAYRNLANGTGASPALGDYTEFIVSEEAYFNSNRYQKDKTYWETKYSARPEESSIRFRSVPASSVAAKRMTRALSLSLEKKLSNCSRERRVTPAVLFETAVILYLAKINPENSAVTIGVPVLNRSSTMEKGIAGMFVSTMPLTVEINPEMSVIELEKAIAKEHMDIFRHQKYPYAKILKSLREKQNFSGNLYDVMISYQNARTDTCADTKWYSNGYSEIPLTIHIDNRDDNESHTITIDYQTEVFCDAEVGYLMDRIEFVLAQAAENGNRKVRDIQLVPRRELEKLIEVFNDTAADYPRDKCVHELFEEQAGRTPEKVALVAEDRILTYRELNAMANRVAHALMQKKIIVGDIVAFALPKKSYMIAVMLGILKSGAAYMPIDMEYPQERIDYMLADSQAKIFITETNYKEYTDYLDSSNIKLKMSSGNPCYCIYTSGSTGNPKGALLCHRGIVNLLSYEELYSCLKKCSRVGLLTTITFDVATQEIFTTLLTGRTGYLLGDKNKMSVTDVISTMRNYSIEMIFSTPSYFNILSVKKKDVECLLQSLKAVVLAGEKFYLNDTIIKEFNNSKVIFENQYGPAETHVITTTTTINDLEDITIGRPIANTQIYILDPDSNPLPIGVAGELCIAGDGVGLGYLNRPELTAERFVTNPFATEANGHGKVMYRTGDLARWRADGEIEYLGRIDTQVKIRGLRIELGEIESVMGSFPGIALCAVADKKDESGRQYLVGYYTTAANEVGQVQSDEAGQDVDSSCAGAGQTSHGAEVDERKLREHLSAKLPRYMVPNYFMHLETMPMTPSGKTDRKSLPAPDFALLPEAYVAPETETEKRLAAIWKDLLKLPQIGKTDDFFELGGDSLLAISLINEIAETFCVELSVRSVMEKSSLELLANTIGEYEGQSGQKIERIVPLHGDRFVLLSQQKAIYAACRKEPEALIYNMPCKIPLPQDIDRNRLKACICKVLENRKILKCRVVSEADEIYGIYEENAKIVFEDYKEKDFVRPFDLEKAPLLRVGLTEDSLLFDIHHIIADGGTLNLILRDIVRAYAGEDLPEETLWYGDYAQHFRESDFAEHRNYFKTMLDVDFERAEFPVTKEPAHGGESRFYELPEEVFTCVKKYAAQNGLTDTMVFAGAYGILLSKYTAKRDVLGSIILQNRTHADTRDMAGMFVNTLPVHFKVNGPTKDYFSAVRELLLNLFRFQELPFWEIADAVGMEDKTAVNTSFVYQADGEKKLELDGHSLLPEFVDTRTAKFDFSMEITPQEKGARMRLEYNCEKYDGALMEELAAAYQRILEQLTKENVAEISVLSEEMYRKVTEEFNDTATDYPRDKCVHELFEEQAGRTPEKVALMFENESFSYRQLDEMSNSLAHFLRERGVGRGDVVPIIARRSWHIVVAMLGILKAGAAYMPISPDYPEERINYMLETAHSRFALLYGYDGTRGLSRQGVNVTELAVFDF